MAVNLPALVKESYLLPHDGCKELHTGTLCEERDKEGQKGGREGGWEESQVFIKEKVTEGNSNVRTHIFSQASNKSLPSKVKENGPHKCGYCSNDKH